MFIINFFSQLITVVFWFVVVLVPLVAVHEFGHYLMARINGVKIPEFGIGFPVTKRWFFRSWKGTIWSFYPVLIGGFVRIYGDNDALDHAQDEFKTDPKKAASDYLEARFVEIIQNRELEFFIKENNLEWDESWQKFATSKFANGKKDQEEESNIQEFESKYNQVLTLISWEFENKLEAKDAFFSKNWFQQSLIISGGVLFNFISAILILWFLFAFITQTNVPKPIDEIANLQEHTNLSFESEYTKVAGVQENTPADRAGLSTQDQLISFDGIEINNLKSLDEFRELVDNNKDQEIEIQFIKDGESEIQTATTTIDRTGDKYIFGIGPLYREVTFKARNIGSAFSLSIDRNAWLIEQTFGSLGQIGEALLPGDRDREVLNQVSGPIAVGNFGSVIFDIAGFVGILELMAALSIALAVFNLLPIPALDGGRWVIITINKILGKRSRKIEGAVISVSFILMLGLAVVVATKDFITIFRW